MGCAPPTCVDIEWAWHGPTQSSPWTTELTVLLQEPLRPPLRTLCAKTCWVFFTWVGMSRPSDCERCVFTGFQKHERETRDPVLI